MASVRAQAQAAIGGDAAVEAFQEFKAQVHRIENDDRDTKMRDALKDWAKVPEIRFRPIAPMGTSPSLPSMKQTPERSDADERRDAIRRALKDPKIPLPKGRK